MLSSGKRSISGRPKILRRKLLSKRRSRPPVVVEQPRDMTTAQNISMLPATLRLLHHLGNIFHHDALISPTAVNPARADATFGLYQPDFPYE